MHMKSPGKIFTLFSVVEVESEIGQETNGGHFTRDTSSPCQHHRHFDKKNSWRGIQGPRTPTRQGRMTHTRPRALITKSNKVSPRNSAISYFVSARSFTIPALSRQSYLYSCTTLSDERVSHDSEQAKLILKAPRGTWLAKSRRRIHSSWIPRGLALLDSPCLTQGHENVRCLRKFAADTEYTLHNGRLR